ncbi:hypothetical protein [Pseudoalteromonas sp. NGC95]|uniref:hypothetical protein n=1 Tax=Pseudoalteromonas sp. NGC95 TaxID=2792051 RepID=UPI0018CDB2F8|nr:hypothetical protein [Pseudoalteromonas sp. NGC95]MBH0015769.1 hypothetical protein [Pseudoalteromonas sp. NGC95]
MSKNKISNFVSYCENELGNETWIPLYKNLDSDDKTIDGSQYSCLAPIVGREVYMDSYGWDLSYGSGSPSIILCGDDVSYEEHTSEFLPLVFVRDFIGRKEKYNEILQELVLYLGLYNDTKNSKYIIDDDNGKEIEVIRYSKKEIVIRTSFLKAFMAAKQMNLLLFFESSFHFNEEFDNELIIKKNNIRYDKFSNDSYVKGYKNFTRVVGKKLIDCQKLTEKSASPFSLEEEYEDFIIEGDEHDSKYHSCNPSILADYFGGNPDAPHYLTQIFFSKDVMQRYYNASTEYEVSDSMIYKVGYWQLKIDNNSKDHVCVFLGDLGKSIPNSEQKYWKCFNIGAENKEMSNTYFERSMLGKWSNPESPDLIFKGAFKRFQSEWFERFGWYLFLPLTNSDLHCFNTLHCLTKNEQSEFDSQVLSLVKITIDSINVKGVKAVMPCDESGSIKLFSAFLKSKGINFDAASFLGGLQGVRSTGVAHRRGSKYEKTINRLNIDDSDLVFAFDKILEQMIELLNSLTKILE